MKKVQVLMSTYNGERFIKEQIESILQQKKVEVSLLIRDDGSTDRTIDIIKEYKKVYSNIDYYIGENIGACQSFLQLLATSDDDVDAYAFADQDDVWKEYKLYYAVEKINVKDSKPQLYCSNIEIVDFNLNLIKENKKEKRPSFGNALIENICTGCTMVLNHSLRDLILKYPCHVNKVVMHDWWIYLISSCFGTVYYDMRSTMYYRQHGNNVIGNESNFYKHLKKRVKNYSSMKINVVNQVEEFYKVFGRDISKKYKKMINIILMKEKNFIKRTRIFKIKEIHRISNTDNIIYKILFLFW